MLNRFKKIEVMGVKDSCSFCGVKTALSRCIALGWIQKGIAPVVRCCNACYFVLPGMPLNEQRMIFFIIDIILFFIVQFSFGDVTK